MRKITRLAGLCMMLCLSALAFWGCLKDKTTKTYTIQRPIIKPLTDVLASINGNTAEPVGSAGKLYIRGNYIFLNEVDKGIHVIDNTDPSHPVQTAYLNIPGNRDMAVKGNILYADMYASLIALDISDLHHVSVKKSIPDFFTSRRVFMNGTYTDSSQVVVGWIKKDTTVNVEDYNGGVVAFLPGCANCSFFSLDASKASSSTGTAGSMAAMVLLNNYLYAITEPHSVGIVNISNEAAPAKAGNMSVGFDLQTIYPFQDKLFLGSASGMYMLDVSDPVHPKNIGQFSHGRACDPVITDGSYAYVTLHAGTNCGGASNELNVIDVQNILKPNLVKTYQLTKPTGLSKDGDLLFICDGSDGVKLFNAADPAGLKLLQQIQCTDPYDVIAANKRALVVTKEGLNQYDYSNINQIKLLSSFSIRQ
ncbi:MAG: hypothetical protein INR73_26450 [Williamsia sp.]|nr:hypothetical protein [Williamsia sp.]